MTPQQTTGYQVYYCTADGREQRPCYNHPLNEHIARDLAAYDQRIEDADADWHHRPPGRYEVREYTA